MQFLFGAGRMTLSGLFVQFINGLAEASSLFLVAAGLSLIFGVTRIVNFAHGSLYMLGLYVAYSLVERWGDSALGFWTALLCAALLIAMLGLLIEVLLLRRIYRAPEMFQLLATFALVLIFNDAALWLWGPDDLLGPLAPGLDGAVELFGRYVPVYDLLLVAIGPLVLLALWLLLTRTRWGALIRAATQDREMLGALGVNQAWLFTSVFALGAFLAALGGALQIPRQPAALALDLSIIGDVFVVVVVGGMGSIPGAYLAALLIAQVKALCIALGVVSIGGFEFAFPKLTLAVEFICMALVLVFRPWGLLGKPLAQLRHQSAVEAPLAQSSAGERRVWLLLLAALALTPLLSSSLPYAPILIQDILMTVLFAASLHFMMGPGGMVSFGHAAYFGLGAYAAALLFKLAGWSMPAAMLGAPVLVLLAAIVFGWFCVRLSGVYLAMLTLAFAQIVWSIIFQWDGLTGGSNGIIGIWPAQWLSGDRFFYLVLAVVVAGAWMLRRMQFSPFGHALRASRDSAMRADACGIPVRSVQWAAFSVAGLFAGLAGVLFVFAKGGASPEVISVAKSVDALVMVLLGGIQAMAGPVLGAASFTLLQDWFVGATEYWRALFGLVILALVLLFPSGLAGAIQLLRDRVHGKRRNVRKGKTPEGGKPLHEQDPWKALAQAMDGLPGAARTDGGAAAMPAADPGHSGGSASSGEPLLKVRGLTKRFGGNVAVDDVEFSLAPGEMLALIGPNGAGKSTTFNMLGGQLKADGGSVLFDGDELLGRPSGAMAAMGIGRTFQISTLFASMRVVENVQIALMARQGRIWNGWKSAADIGREAALELLDQVGMRDQADLPCSQLAYGDVKRVELAVSLAAQPRLLLMDEPTAGMAPSERAGLMALVRRLAKERNMAVLFTEHSMDVVFGYADRIVVLSRGRLIAQGDAQSIQNDAQVQAVYFGTGKTFDAR